MGNEINLGISSYGLANGEFIRQLEKSVAETIETNDPYKALASTFDIQRRGYHYPGDTNSFSQLGPMGEGSSPYGYHGRDAGNLTDMAMGLGNFGAMEGVGIYNAMGNGHYSDYGSQFSRIAKMKMAMCVQAYKGFGVAKNVIDLMANFAAEGLKIKHPRRAIERFYQRWAELVDLNGRVKDALRYYYKFGNVFLYSTMGTIDEDTYRAMKNANASTLKLQAAFTDTQDPAKDEREKQVEIEKGKPEKARQIPWRYTLLNPFQMDTIGDKYFGQSRWVFVLDEKTAHRMRLPKAENVDFLDDTEVNLPPEFKELVEKNRAGTETRIVDLKQENLWTMHYMKDDHEEWADPMLWPVMADIQYKNKLRQSDISVCNSIIKAITVFKIGDYKNGFIPGPEYLRKFSELLRTPTEAMTLTWNDAIEVIHSYPPVEKMLSADKYEAVDRDILRGIGVPDVLLGGGGGGNFSNGFLGVRTLLERLEEGRHEVEKWINKQLRMIAEIMGHRDIPKVKFGRMSLRDENAEKNLVLGLLDRNVISVEAVLEVFGEDFEMELARLRREQELRDDEGILQKHGPFINPLVELTDIDIEQLDHETEQMEKKQELNMQVMDKEMKQQKEFKKIDNVIKKQGSKNGGKKIGGRPANSKGIPQAKKRSTKPKGMAFLQYETDKASASRLYTAVEEIITGCVLESTGKKYKKSLTKEERTGIEELSFAVSSWLSINADVTLDIVQKIMSQDTLTVASDVLESEQMLFSSFMENNMRSPTVEERRDIRAQAIALTYVEEENEDERAQ